MNKLGVVITCVIFLLLYNYSIYSKEKHLRTGEIVNLELEPVDPRSLMQGDFMDLDYDMSRKIRRSIIERNQINGNDKPTNALFIGLCKSI